MGGARRGRSLPLNAFLSFGSKRQAFLIGADDSGAALAKRSKPPYFSRIKREARSSREARRAFLNHENRSLVMKKIFLPLTAAIAVALAGCGKKESEPSAATPPVGDLEKMVGAVKTATQSISQSVNQAAARLEQAIPDATQAAADAANALASGDANALLEQAKKLAGESKIKEAGEIVQKLSSLQLTEEQTKLLAEIKALIQKATSADPAGAAAGALGGQN